MAMAQKSYGIVSSMGQSQFPRYVVNLLSYDYTNQRKIPTSRFDASLYQTEKGDDDPRTMAARHGGFLDDIWAFDNAFFKVTPREAKSMDPQQRVLLQTAQAALDDAGYVPDSTPTFQRASIGCYIGVATEDYTDNLRDDIDVFYSTGRLMQLYSGYANEDRNFTRIPKRQDFFCTQSERSVNRHRYRMLFGASIHLSSVSCIE